MNDLVETQAFVTVAQDDIRARIHTIRGMQVVLDSDLAMLYHVETRVFNQAVKRNAERFPANFRFQLTAEEHRLLLSQIVTAKRERGVETRGGQHIGWRDARASGGEVVGMFNRGGFMQVPLLIIR